MLKYWNGKNFSVFYENILERFEITFRTSGCNVKSFRIASYLLGDVLTDFPNNSIFLFKTDCGRVGDVSFVERST